MGDRRAFLRAAIGSLAALRAEAQPRARAVRIAVLDEISSREAPWHVVFRGRLGELGYVEGRNLVVEFRSASGHPDRLSSLVAEVIGLKPDVIVALGSHEAPLALKTATTTVPVVFSAVEWDPVATGLIASLVRPGGNLTGVSALAVELAVKRLEVLKDLVPRATRVAVLWHRPRAADQLRTLKEAAQVLKLQILSFPAGDPPHSLETIFQAAVRQGAHAMMVLGSPVFFPQRQRLADLALRHRLPAGFQRPAYVEAGGLMSYGPDIDDIMRRLADYVDRILKGASPAEIPVEQPRSFQLVVNARSAQALGLSVPPSVLARADRVIE